MFNRFNVCGWTKAKIVVMVVVYSIVMYRIFKGIESNVDEIRLLAVDSEIGVQNHGDFVFSCFQL